MPASLHIVVVAFFIHDRNENRRHILAQVSIAEKKPTRIPVVGSFVKSSRHDVIALGMILMLR